MAEFTSELACKSVIDGHKGEATIANASWTAPGRGFGMRRIPRRRMMQRYHRLTGVVGPMNQGFYEMLVIFLMLVCRIGWLRPMGGLLARHQKLREG